MLPSLFLLIFSQRYINLYALSRPKANLDAICHLLCFKTREFVLWLDAICTFGHFDSSRPAQFLVVCYWFTFKWHNFVRQWMSPCVITLKPKIKKCDFINFLPNCGHIIELFHDHNNKSVASVCFRSVRSGRSWGPHVLRVQLWQQCHLCFMWVLP
jgi:hypothetical protein